MITFLLGRLFPNPVKEKVAELIGRATSLGLRAEDRRNALDMLEHNEWGVAFEIVVTQLYEYDIPVDRSFLEAVQEIGDAMKVDRGEYDFLKKLVQDEP